MSAEKVFDDGETSIFVVDGENLEVDPRASEFADLVLDRSDQLTRELVIKLSQDEATKMSGYAVMPQQELWIAIALRLGFPGNYKAAAGGKFAQPAIDYIIQKTEMFVHYSKDGYELFGYPHRHEGHIIQVINDKLSSPPEK